MPLRKTAIKTPPDFFLRFPGSTLVIALLADKWTIPVIHALARGTRRTNELKRQLPGISQKMLTQTLRALETHGLIERKVYAEVPPRVDYRLTALGVSLNEPLQHLCSWAERHGGDLEQRLARRRRR
jgi:DNA-binding HxlR family transcriptional regulator